MQFDSYYNKAIDPEFANQQRLTQIELMKPAVSEKKVSSITPPVFNKIPHFNGKEPSSQSNRQWDNSQQVMMRPQYQGIAQEAVPFHIWYNQESQNDINFSNFNQMQQQLQQVQITTQEHMSRMHSLIGNG